MMKKHAIYGMLAVLLASSATPVMAQGITIGPDGVRVQDDRRGPPPPPRGRDVSEREAIRIARSEGLREVDRIQRTPRAYRIDGFDRRGDDIRVVVDRRSGEVLEVR